MPDITLWLGPVITSKDLEYVRDTLPRVQAGEHLTISLEAADAHQIGSLIELLDLSGFDYQSRGDSDGKTYHIVASRPQRK